MFFKEKVMLFVCIFSLLIFLNAVVGHPLKTLNDGPTKFQLFGDSNQNTIAEEDDKNPGRVTRNTVFIAPKFMPLESQIDNQNHESFIMERLADIEYEDSDSDGEEEIIIDIVEVQPNAAAGYYIKKSNLEKRHSESPIQTLKVATDDKREEIEITQDNSPEESTAAPEILNNPITDNTITDKNWETTTAFQETTSLPTTTLTPKVNVPHQNKMIDIAGPLFQFYKNFIKKYVNTKNTRRMIISKLFHKENKSNSNEISKKSSTKTNADLQLSQSENSSLAESIEVSSESSFTEPSKPLPPSLDASLFAKSLAYQQELENSESSTSQPVYKSSWNLLPIFKQLKRRLKKNFDLRRFYSKNQLYPLYFKYRHKN